MRPTDGRIIALSARGLDQPACSYWTAMIDQLAVWERALLVEDGYHLSAEQRLRWSGRRVASWEEAVELGSCAVLDFGTVQSSAFVDARLRRSLPRATILLLALAPGLEREKLESQIALLKEIEPRWVLCGDRISELEAAIGDADRTWLSERFLHLPEAWFAPFEDRADQDARAALVRSPRSEAEGFRLAPELADQLADQLKSRWRAEVHLGQEQESPAVEELAESLFVVDERQGLGQRQSDLERCVAKGTAYFPLDGRRWWRRPDADPLADEPEARSLRASCQPVLEILREVRPLSSADVPLDKTDPAVALMSRIEEEDAGLRWGPPGVTVTLLDEFAGRSATFRPVAAVSSTKKRQALRRSLWEISEALEQRVMPFSPRHGALMIDVWSRLAEEASMRDWGFFADYLAARWPTWEQQAHAACQQRSKAGVRVPQGHASLVLMSIHTCLGEFAFLPASEWHCRMRERCDFWMQWLDQAPSEDRESSAGRVAHIATLLIAGRSSDCRALAEGSCALKSHPQEWIELARYAACAGAVEFGRWCLDRVQPERAWSERLKFQYCAASLVVKREAEGRLAFERLGERALESLRSESIGKLPVFHFWNGIIASNIGLKDALRAAVAFLSAYPYNQCWHKALQNYLKNVAPENASIEPNE